MRSPFILERPVLQDGEVDAGITYAYQYSEQASAGCVVVSDPHNRYGSGQVSYNLRTESLYECTIAELKTREKQLSVALRGITTFALKGMISTDAITGGYPEIQRMTEEITKQEAVPHTELQKDDLYMYRSKTHGGEYAFSLFQFTGLEERRDGFGVPCTGILYDRTVLRVRNQDRLAFDGVTYQPQRNQSQGALEGCEAFMYDDSVAHLLRPEHFIALPTEKAFYPATHQDVQRTLDLVEPQWPYVAPAELKGFF